jgi:hypothetical protein
MANSYLNRTVSSAGNRKTFTLSAWVKRGKISSGEHNIFGNSDSSYDNGFVVKFNSSDQLRIIMQDSSNYEKKPNRLFRDCNGWYHLVIQVDTTQATATDRVKLWVNGVQETSFATDTMPAQNYDTHWNNTTQITTVGRAGNYNGDYYDGYITHAANVDGSVVAPTVFGETDSTSGIWKFKQPSGVTWGTNGFWLKFENSGALGTDSSGNSNTFTVNGNGRQALDTPSNVYATLNSIANYRNQPTMTNGNLTLTGTGSSTTWNNSVATLGATQGKWYYEYKITGGTHFLDILLGIVNVDKATTTANNLYTQNGSCYYYGNDGGEILLDSTQTTNDYGASAQNDIIGIAYDLDTYKFNVYKNGTQIVTNFALSSNFQDGGFIIPSICVYEQSVGSANFGNGYFGTTAISSAGSNGNGSLFEYDVPSGYYALNTKNINTYG